MNNYKGGFGGGFGGFGGGINQLMKQAQKMQKDIETAKEEIAEKEFKATVGGGMVEVVMMGNRTVKSVKLVPEIINEVINANDVELLEDLICAAMNDVLTQIENIEKEKLPQMPGM
ncbi:MAG: YbaB/EbfC family nucleoid-associated protein [Clostridia bacterium]|nr:YbaB/EbfC family nucleoid-associated protein [Clostridia bacterium]MDD3231742.1 YbaB/EbfC family nucleoid-associated protein [Clostridia bacterium]MDD3862316.1 YbaB/EbfC family nucleoid-associated protein [Clostridia bacterium]